MAGAGALEGLEPGVLQALVGRGGHWLACSLTQLLPKHIEGNVRDTGARAQQLKAQMYGSLGAVFIENCIKQGCMYWHTAAVLMLCFCDQLACKNQYNQLLAETSVIILCKMT